MGYRKAVNGADYDEVTLTRLMHSNDRYRELRLTVPPSEDWGSDLAGVRERLEGEIWELASTLYNMSQVAISDRKPVFVFGEDSTRNTRVAGRRKTGILKQEMLASELYEALEHYAYWHNKHYTKVDKILGNYCMCVPVVGIELGFRCYDVFGFEGYENTCHPEGLDVYPKLEERLVRHVLNHGMNYYGCRVTIQGYWGRLNGNFQVAPKVTSGNYLEKVCTFRGDYVCCPIDLTIPKSTGGVLSFYVPEEV